MPIRMHNYKVGDRAVYRDWLQEFTVTIRGPVDPYSCGVRATRDGSQFAEELHIDNLVKIDPGTKAEKRKGSLTDFQEMYRAYVERALRNPWSTYYGE